MKTLDQLKVSAARAASMGAAMQSLSIAAQALKNAVQREVDDVVRTDDEYQADLDLIRMSLQRALDELAPKERGTP